VAPNNIAPPIIVLKVALLFTKDLDNVSHFFLKNSYVDSEKVYKKPWINRVKNTQRWKS